MNNGQQCACGCGQLTKIAMHTDNRGYDSKGQPRTFLRGHNLRVRRFAGQSFAIGEAHPFWSGGKYYNKHGYIMVYSPRHARAQGDYVPEHILVVEKIIGASVLKQHPIHHANEVKSDNRQDNLVVCENDAYHSLLHYRTRAYKQTGTVKARKCRYCKEWMLPDAPDIVILKRSKNSNKLGACYHRSCVRETAQQKRHMRHIGRLITARIRCQLCRREQLDLFGG